MTNVNDIAKLLSSYKITMAKIDALKGQISSVEQLMKYMDEPRFFGDKALKPKKGPEKKTLAAMLQRLYDSISSLSNKLQLCETMINSVPPDVSSAVLQYYYINGLTMEQVARKVKYSRTHCWRLWRKGLEYIAAEWGDTPMLLDELSSPGSQQ